MSMPYRIYLNTLHNLMFVTLSSWKNEMGVNLQLGTVGETCGLCIFRVNDFDICPWNHLTDIGCHQILKINDMSSILHGHAFRLSNDPYHVVRHVLCGVDPRAREHYFFWHL